MAAFFPELILKLIAELPVLIRKLDTPCALAPALAHFLNLAIQLKVFDCLYRRPIDSSFIHVFTSKVTGDR